MSEVELKLLDLVREMLSQQSNKRLKKNSLKHTNYTRQLESTIKELTELKRFH